MASSYAIFCILNKPSKSHRFEGLVPMLCKFGKQWHTSEAGSTGGKLTHLGCIFKRDLETPASSTPIFFFSWMPCVKQTSSTIHLHHDALCCHRTKTGIEWSWTEISTVVSKKTFPFKLLSQVFCCSDKRIFPQAAKLGFTAVAAG